MTDFEEEKERIKALFCGMADWKIREITLGSRHFCAVFIGNHSSKNTIGKLIFAPLIRAYEEGETDFDPSDRIPCASVSEVTEEEKAKTEILAGNCFLFWSDMRAGLFGLSLSTRNEEGRGVSEPETENVIRGSHDGFTESAEQNAMLLRRRIKSTALKKRDITLGSLSQTAVSVMYIEGIADPDVIEEVMRRLSRIRMDGILDSGYIELCIQDGRYSVYPTVGNSERPDKVAAKLLEGRVAILADNSPVVLTVPYLFCEALQVTEDYAKSTWYATFIRCIRFTALLIGLYLPALFVAFTVRHPNLLPASFIESLLKSREDLHFSIFAEVLLLFGLFEIIREVGLRMPKSVGSAVGLVGSLILGDSAIKAGIASPTVMVFVALAAICNFILPPYMNANVLYRLFMILVSGVFGLFGFFVFFSASVITLCRKKSFGVSYLYPLAPADFSGLGDFLVMLPIWKMARIPKGLIGKTVFRSSGRRASDEK